MARKKKTQQAPVLSTIESRIRVGRRSYKPSARDLFPILRDRLLASRPILSELDGRPVYGKPTFRNAINENGEHV